MRRKLVMLLLVASLAMPAMAAPRDDSPMDRFGSFVHRVVQRINQIFTLEFAPSPPK